jgi:hypothetical protein
MGINIDDNSETWIAFSNSVKAMTFSVLNQNLETMRTTLADINKITKDVKMGDIISDENYKRLTEIDGTLKKDFVMTADGYMYVGSDNLQDKANNATMT